MKDLVKKIEQNITEYNLLKKGDKVVVGVSGGPDSIMLITALDSLKGKLNIQLVVAHINHKIREEAIFDESLVRDFCAKRNIEFYTLSCDVKKKAQQLKISVEDCGRRVRYDFFNKVCKQTAASKIAVAHNLGDNAETILMNIMRGTGLAGLCGMEFSSGNIIRPMLNIDKKDIIKYLKENGLSYAIDRTNLENDYTRNFIRNVLLKDMEKVNPNILVAFSRMSENLKNDNKSLCNITQAEAQNSIVEKSKEYILVDLKKYNYISPELKPRVVVYTLNELLGNVQGIEQVHIKDICKLLDKGITGKKYIIGNKFYIEILKHRKAKYVKATTIIEK